MLKIREKISNFSINHFISQKSDATEFHRGPKFEVLLCYVMNRANSSGTICIPKDKPCKKKFEIEQEIQMVPEEFARFIT